MPDQENHAIRGDGELVNPRSAIVPIAKRVAPGRLAIIGTGFYVTRYGLFATAAHVLDCSIDSQGNFSTPTYVIHTVDDKTVHMRQIKQISRQEGSDVAIGHAQNFSDKFPTNPLLNLRARITTVIPRPGAPLVTYAYPENEILDFTSPSNTPKIVSDYFDGVLISVRSQFDNPLLPQIHMETSLEIRSGASGGPVFYDGKVVGINCRGWDFQGSEFEGDNLSYVLPFSEALSIEIPLIELAKESWEYRQIPVDKTGIRLSIQDLCSYGHIERVDNG